MAASVSFFEHQQLARRNTRILVVLYLLAVIGVILAVDAVLAGVYLWMESESAVGPFDPRAALRRMPAAVLWGGAALTSGVIVLVSLFHTLKLATGGEAVAQMVGARAVDPNTADPHERRLVNVVEEMAIASGVRVPKIYVMDGESGINAFAAGYEVSNAVVAVTRGTLETLTRDELQGVIAHEFSHILNGDMRLNIRMIGVLQGIVFIGAIGEFLVRSAGRGRGRKDGAAPVLVAGLGLFLVGAIGLLFARLIKAAVSRQREFLADASSVQFTRNPDGIAGALDQIAQRTNGARIEHRRAEELSHLYFGQAVSSWMISAFDTHPSTDERIRRAHPTFRAAEYRRAREARQAAAASAVQPEGGEDGARRQQAAQAVLAAGVLAGGTGRRGDETSTAWGRSSGDGDQFVGRLEADNVDLASRLIAALPDGVHDAVHTPDGASAILIALMLAPPPAVRQVQLEALRALGAQSLAERANAVCGRIGGLDAALRLPLIDLALPALKRAERAERDQWVAALDAVIHADRRVTLHEFVVLTLVRDQLRDETGRVRVRHATIESVRTDALLLLSLVAMAGAPRGDPAIALTALRAGTVAIGLKGAIALDPDARQLERVGSALESLRGLAPLAKAVLVKGLFAVAMHDDRIRVAEAELLRLVGAVLDCPLPPRLEAQHPALAKPA